MSTTITLPAEHPTQDGVIGGVRFIDGKAKVDDLSPNAAAFLKAIGARLRVAKPKAEQGGDET